MNGDCLTSDEDTENVGSEENKRQIYAFEKGHPRETTAGHRYRSVERWPKYSARRLPDLKQLEDNSNINEEERNVKREEYAQGILIMFYPFRTLKGN